MKKIRPVDGARSCVTRNAFASFLAFACFVIVSPAFSQQELREVGVSPLASMNVLTKKQLDQLKFPPDRGLADKRYNKLRLGVWMSKEEYRTGEPIYALFVVKNDGPKRGLDMWLIVSAQESTAWNAGGLTIKLVDKPPGHKHSLQLLSHIWSCPRSSPMTSVGEGSYLCFRGDLHGHRLPPGTYSLSWRYGKSRSNQVQFKILTERAKGAKKRDLMGNHEFYGWITLWTRLRELNVDADGLPHRYVEVAGTRPQFFEGMSRSLAMGHDNRWYPDIYALPTSDDKLRVLARFVRTNLRRGETPATGRDSV